MELVTNKQGTLNLQEQLFEKNKSIADVVFKPDKTQEITIDSLKKELEQKINLQNKSEKELLIEHVESKYRHIEKKATEEKLNYQELSTLLAYTIEYTNTANILLQKLKTEIIENTTDIKPPKIMTDKEFFELENTGQTDKIKKYMADFQKYQNELEKLDENIFKNNIIIADDLINLLETKQQEKIDEILNNLIKKSNYAKTLTQQERKNIKTELQTLLKNIPKTFYAYAELNDAIENYTHKNLKEKEIELMKEAKKEFQKTKFGEIDLLPTNLIKYFTTLQKARNIAMEKSDEIIAREKYAPEVYNFMISNSKHIIHQYINLLALVQNITQEDIPSKKNENEDKFKLIVKKLTSNKPRKYFYENSFRLLDAVEEYSTRKIEKIQSVNLIDKLILAGFEEQHAEFIANSLGDTEEGEAVGINSKNKVYFLKDVHGAKKVIKFVDKKDEADLEMIVNHSFAKHPVLKHFVPGTDIESPIDFEMNGKTKYAVIQNDVRPESKSKLAHTYFKNQPINHQYIEHWIRAIARVHHYGSEIMQEIGEMKPAETISCIPGRVKDLERLEDCKITYNNLSKINEYVDEATEFQKSFIHFDLKPENRLGHYIIDWGGAGWGSHFLDVSMILNDARFPLNKESKEYFVKLYINQRNELIKQEQKNAPFIDEKKGLHEYKTMEFLINSTFTAYYNSKEGLRQDELDRQNLVIVTNKNSVLGKKYKTSLFGNVTTIDKKDVREIHIDNDFNL